MRIFTIFLLLTAGLLAFRSDESGKYPADYFRSPVAPTLRLSGTFGELRPNHFHAGIDIKGHIGQPLLAAADGYVARISVQAGGYGKVLYLNHPNGYTTVYAHMNRFAPVLEEFVKNVQYAEESFEVEIFPEPGQFVFTRGETIGEIGVTGSSLGPHLHFEIRDADTEMAVNPLLFGLEVADARPPRLHELRVYSLDPERRTRRAVNLNLVRKGEGYGLPGDTLRLDTRQAGFGLKAYDHMDGVSNWNGVYSIAMYIDDSLGYAFAMETFAFPETRYLNAHLDYEEQVSRRSYFNRLFRLPGNQLSSIYRLPAEEGVVALDAEEAKKVTIVASDLAGNRSVLEFWVRREAAVTGPGSRVYHYFLPYDEENIIDLPAARVHFPEGTFYEDVFFFLQEADDHSSDIYSPVLHLHDHLTPVHQYYDLSIRPNRLPGAWRSKAFIAYCPEGGRVYNFGGEWRDGMLHSRVRTLGDFCIMVDTIPPNIRPAGFSSDMRGWDRMSFLIDDNVAPAGYAPDLRYRATVDGRWILMEYDEKNDRLSHTFDGSLSPGEHQFRLEVTDGQENTAVLERTILL